MKLESERVYISNLPSAISQSDLEQKFGEYGNVTSVEIKTRKNFDSSASPQFAFVTLNVTQNGLSNCFEDFANKKWKGHRLILQTAKENFMDRLKRERAKKDQMTSRVQPSVSTLNSNTRNVTKVYHSSSSDDEKSEHNENGVDARLLQKHNNSVLMNNDRQNASSNIQEHVAESQDAKTSVAEQKRIESIIKMRRNFQHQKQVLKAALASIDSKPKNKITFDENYEAQTPPPTKKATSTKESRDPENKVALFEEDGEEADNQSYNFNIKEQFEGKQGQKLLQLQSRFKNDKRFAMDKRFLEDDETKTNEDNPEITIDEEKQKQFEILEQVLGKKIKHNSSQKDGGQNIKMMLRFDPTQPTHSKFEIKEKKAKSKKEDRESNVKEVEEAPVPEVSKETFYNVSVNLKDALQEKQEFSLANLFNKTMETGVNEKQDTTINDKTKSSTHNEFNPFPYSQLSDDDDNETPMETEEKLTTVPSQYNKMGPAKLWTESFFFKNDDYRLQEGLDFIKRLEVDDQSDFPKIRRNLHEIVKAKVRNNLRKNRPFKKKLGGKKRLRVKRAMKR